jgi:hypothetical protein
MNATFPTFLSGMRSEIENMDANGMNWGVGPDTHCQAIYDKDVEGD